MTEIKTLLKHKLLPQCTEDITEDEILFFNNDYLVTQWKAKSSNMNIASALSVVSVEHGIQISKKYDKDKKFCYWYCDIVKTKWTPESSCFEITDLLVDVVVFPDNELRMIDLDEFTQSKNNGLLNTSDFQWAQQSVLKLINQALLGDFPPKHLFESILQNIPSDFFKAD